MNRYNITQSPLYKLSNKRRLEELLHLPKYILNKREKWIKYKYGEIPKKDGDFRKISKPSYKLKSVQKKIQLLLSKIERPDWLISGEKNKCYINNAQYHQNNNYVITSDIKKFYDNCRREPVYQALKNKFKMSSDVAGVVTDIITYNGGIPTGAPTSQLIAYYAYEDMFNEINLMAISYDCKFSLYVDDMTFSSTNPINVEHLKKDLDDILNKYHHKLKYEKFKYYSYNEDKLITGVTLKSNNQLAVSNKLRFNIIIAAKNMQLRKNSHITPQKLKQLQSLSGRLTAAKIIEPNIFPEISRLIKNKS